MRRRLIALTCCAVMVGACSPEPEVETLPPMKMEDPLPLEGPLAPEDRAVEPLTVEDSPGGTARVARVDLGNATEFIYTTPVRGLVVAPMNLNPARPAPVVVLSHLRAPTCDDLSSEYPCPEGTTQLRYDEGWLYLAEALAAEGYVSIVPDLGPTMIPVHHDSPYSQENLWAQVVGRFLEKLRADAEGTNELGLALAGAVDLESVSLVAHSRSALMAERFGRLVGEGNLRGVLTFGGAYEVFDPELITPHPADVPYLAVEGDLDSDVGRAPSMWLANATASERTQPAFAVQLRGVGHMGINTTAISAGIEDRTACDLQECVSDQQVQRVWVDITTAWLNATVRGEPGPLPLTALDPLPQELAGITADWLALTPGAALRLLPEDFTALPGAEVTVCRHADPMMPAPAGACPDPELGVIEAIAPVALTTGAAAQVEPTPAQGLAVHLAPWGSTDTAVEVHVDVTLASGRVLSLAIPAQDPTVMSRVTEHSNGMYGIRTWRAALPAEATTDPVVGIALRSTSPVELRGVDLIT